MSTPKISTPSAQTIKKVSYSVKRHGLLHIVLDMGTINQNISKFFIILSLSNSQISISSNKKCSSVFVCSKKVVFHHNQVNIAKTTELLLLYVTRFAKGTTSVKTFVT